MPTWRAIVQHDSADFQMERVRLLLAAKDDDGLRSVLPVKVELGELFSPGVISDPLPDPFLALPEEAAAALFEALARHFTGTSDVLRLHRELAAERRRVDALIAGLGRVGGMTE